MKKHLTNLTNLLPGIFNLRIIGALILISVLNISIATASENLLGERIHIKVENVTLKDALKEIERQSEFTFLYNDASIDVNQIVTVSASELTVKDLLDQILVDKDISYTIIDNQIVLTKTSGEQENKITVSGQITDSETGEGLPGVTVLEKGTSNGTITDLDGNYTLSVAENATLQVSYVGYVTEEIVVGGQTSISVALVPDIISLDDVVVIGYGTVKKSDLTGAVASVSAEELSKSAVSGVDQALQGRTAGVTVTANSGAPGAAPSVRIRGMGTVTNPNPFFVVDGIPVEASDVGALNPGDIESTEILKDASAAAIYGSRAANGVVIITTKRGKEGSTSVSFDAYTGVQSLAKKYELVNAEEYITIRNKLGAYEWEDSSAVTNTDWQDEIFRNAKISNYQLSFLGGSEKIKYAFITSYMNQEGIIKSTGYERLTFRLNTSADIKPWLTVGENISYSISTTDVVQEQDEYTSVVATALTIDPATPVYDSAGVPATAIRNNIKNPIGSIEYDDDTRKNNKLIGNAYMDLKPFEWLTFKTSFGMTLTDMRQEVFQRDYNESTTYFRNQNQLVNANYDYRTLIMENTLNFNRSFGDHDIQALVGYTRQSNIYRYRIALANDVPEDENIRFISNTSDPETILYGDIAETVGGYNVMNPINPYGNLDPYDSYLISYLGRVMYNYADLLDLHASVRRDGSSRFGEQNKWGVFPSFAGGLKISQFAFMQNVSAINFLKIRIGWGKLGNQEVNDYRAYTGVQSNLNYTLGAAGEQYTLPGGAPTSIGNQDLKWESTVMTNIGLDLNMFDNKVSLNADYFIRTTEDMLVAVPIPGHTGVSEAPLVNKGSIRNNGLELNLIYKNRSGDFTYEVSGNVAFIKNEVLELGAADDYIQSGVFRASNYISRTMVGEPIASFYGYKTDGYWESQEEINQANERARNTSGDEDAVFDKDDTSPGDVKFVDINGDNMITVEDRTIIGNPTPDVTYGLNINLGYKMFDFSIFGQGVAGNEIFQALIYYQEGSNAYWNMNPNMINTWEEPNSGATAPRLDQYNRNDNLRLSDRYVKNGSFFRIKNVQLGVTLPKNLTEQVGISKFRVYVSGQNLITFSDYSGFDPEIGTGRGNREAGRTGVLDIGIDRGFYPIARSFMIGAQLTF